MLFRAAAASPKAALLMGCIGAFHVSPVTGPHRTAPSWAKDRSPSPSLILRHPGTRPLPQPECGGDRQLLSTGPGVLVNHSEDSGTEEEATRSFGDPGQDGASLQTAPLHPV
ncbi:hypothetical protein TREES_T100011698 [Tupaia chinensis]|uniref:Uncharacterized protein n=1 Tax=Tupaia chinensis TaxID=246437 RepID=L9L0K8_TUPCH|nr:hypothetical protein TREES_T100011698 [Tupaia chinensis]